MSISGRSWLNSAASRGVSNTLSAPSNSGNGIVASRVDLDLVAGCFEIGFGLSQECPGRLELFLVQRPAGIAEVGDGANFHFFIFFYC